MATITRNPRNARVQERGSRGTKEALLAGPGTGCNRFTVRRILLEPDGRTARTAGNREIVYVVQRGSITLSHLEGELDLLSAGDSVTVHPGELHHLHNVSKSVTEVLKVASQ